MPQELKKEKYRIEGMTCSGCENRIENAVGKLEGVESVRASSANSEATVVYDPAKTGPDDFKKAVENLDYRFLGQSKTEVKKPLFRGIAQILGTGIAVFGIYFLIQNTVGFSFIPQITQDMGFGILFVVGLITSLHCVAMCGGINLSQCVRSDSGDGKPASIKSGILPSLLYNSGRVVSYTVIGGIAGAVGSAFSFSPIAKGAIAVIAGIFMLVMGLNMLKAFSFLEKFHIRLPKFFTPDIRSRAGKYGPFVVGLLNGLMPCGPLQAMQVYALGTGSALTGALSMFFFSVGTVPLMFGLGAAGTMLTKKFTNVMFRVGGVLVFVLGFFMVNNGLSMSGKPVIPVQPVQAAADTNSIVMEDGKQVVRTEVLPSYFAPITVRKGIPVKWILHVRPENLNGCNNAVIVPDYGIQKQLSPGDNVIEFTPDRAGTIPYSCWMGMIRSRIDVIDSGATNSITNAGGAFNPNGGNSCCQSSVGTFRNCCAGRNGYRN